MKIIGLDVSTHTGYSIIDTVTGHHCEGEVEFPKLTGMARVAAFKDWWQIMYTSHNPDLVVIEGYGFAGNSLSQLVEIGTMFKLGCYERGIRMIEVAPSALKKFATGKGVGNKDLIMMHVLKTWDYESATNNIADAYVLSKIGEAIAKPDLAWIRAHHREVIAKALAPPVKKKAKTK